MFSFLVLSGRGGLNEAVEKMVAMGPDGDWNSVPGPWQTTGNLAEKNQAKQQAQAILNGEKAS